MYWRSIKIKAAKYMFSAGTASWISAASELKIRISVSGMRMIMLHMTAV